MHARRQHHPGPARADRRTRRRRAALLSAASNRPRASRPSCCCAIVAAGKLVRSPVGRAKPRRKPPNRCTRVYQEAMRELAGFLTQPPGRERYEVLLEERAVLPSRAWSRTM